MNVAANGFSPPQTFSVNPANCPPDLRNVPRWVLWEWEHKPSNQKKPWTKPPISPFTFYKENHQDPKHQTTFDDAFTKYRERGYPGIGFSMTAPFVGVDLDNCIITVDGKWQIADWALEWIRYFNSYTELSPSGTGIRIFCKGELASGGHKKGDREIYQDGRYLTFTGQHLPGTPKEIYDRQEQAAKLYFEIEAELAEPKATKTADHQVITKGDYEQPRQSQPGVSVLTDDEVISLAPAAANGAAFSALWGGSWQEKYPSQSEADQALCCYLAFWCGNCAEQVDRLFRRSGLYRDKWDRDDYRDRTIQRAIDATPEPYQGGKDAPGGILQDGVNKLLKDNPDFFGSKNSTTAHAAPKKTERKRRGYSVKELKALPRPKWQIRDHIQQNTLCSVFADFETYKTFYVIGASCSIATGLPFLGKFPVIQGKVLYICSEGGFNVRQRFEAWERHNKVETTSDNLIIIPSSFNLLLEAEVREILQIAQETLGGSPTFIVIDTLSRNMEGNECAPEDMSRFVRSLDYLKDNTRDEQGIGASIVVVCHKGWENKYREALSSKFPAAVDTRIELQKGKDKILVNCAKQKDSEHFRGYLVTKKKLAWQEEDGPISSLVLEYAGEQPTKKEEQTADQGNIWERICTVLQQQGSVNFETLKTALESDGKVPGKNGIYPQLNLLSDSGVVAYSTKTKKYSLTDGWETPFNLLLNQ